jgi:hypothetical protein
MDKVDLGEKINRKKLEYELVDNKLDTTPWLLPESTSGWRVVKFGNTGFNINLSPWQNSFDFIPEDAHHRNEYNSARYASILGASLFELHGLLNDEKGMNDVGMNTSDIRVMSTGTNETMVKGILGLFSRSKVPDLAKGSTEDPPKIKIDLQGFKELKMDDPLMQYLYRLSERAKDITVKYEKRTDYPY